MNKTLALVIALLLPALAGAQNEITFAYAPEDSPYEPSGTGKAETYDIAIALTNASLEGKVIKQIKVPVIPSEKVGNLSIWIAKKLKLELDPETEKNRNVVDKSWSLDMPATGEMQFLTLVLDEPYTIPEGGLYVGYSLTVNNIDKTEGTQVPIVTCLGAKDGSFYIHTSRSFLNWQDRSAELGAIAMTQVLIEGDIMLNAGILGALPERYCVAGEPTSITVPVHNVGLNPIASIGYRATADDVTIDGNIELEEPIKAVYAYSEDVEFELPIVASLGIKTIELEITSVNGEPNETRSVAEGTLQYLKFIPKHTPLVEEFTGTWCGWCPRGFVAMEKMNELYPDFVGIAYHDSDPMSMVSGYPLLTSGFPKASFNREFSIDPYYAFQDKGFGLPALWESSCNDFTPVAISAQACWNADSTVTVTTKAEWALVYEFDADATFRIEYVLLADDLHSEDITWRQKNYYATEPVEEYMDFFCRSGSYVYDLHYNDVAILTSGGKGVEGSLPKVEEGVEYSHTFTLDARKALHTAKTLIPFDKDKLRVAAFVLRDNGSYGTVLNATKCDVEVDPASAPVIATDDNAEATYYDLQGRKVEHPQQGGIYIRVSNSKASKIVFK